MDVEARLRAFAAVARERSFSVAAERLYVSQPAISKHVASLEAELGKQLVVRDRRGLRLTPAGELLAEYVLRAEALLANARRALGSDAEEASGTLALAASGIPGTYLLPELLGRFSREHPGVMVDFQVSTSRGALELVRAHKVELAVVGGMVVPQELESEPLLEDEIVIVGGPELAGRRLRPRDLEGLTWMSREEGSSTRAAVEAARVQIGLHEVRTLELPSWEAVKRAVTSGAGIAAISRHAIELELEAGRLAILEVPRWRVTRTIAVVTARGVPLTPPAARFLDLLRTAFATAPDLTPNSNLPAPASSLIGRDRELEEIVRLLKGRTRMVTVTGPGGTGKTSLALAAAARLVDDFHDGVYLVDLSPIRDPKLVIPTIGRALGVPDGESVEPRLHGRRLLLLVDNFEQVAGAASSLATLLSAAPRVKALVTSRTPLQVADERLFDLPPLGSHDAVALFLERALAAHPAFVDDGAVTKLCRRLDGLPLAIELAAARALAFPPAAILKQLERGPGALVGGRRNAPARQRTLRGAIDWSVELLGADARDHFGAMGVFAAGCSAEAASEVTAATPAVLDELVRSSLVRASTEPAGGIRYVMLETIREHAAELLAEMPEQLTIERRHLDWVTKVARESQRNIRGPEEKLWLDRVTRELPEVRLALARSLARGEPGLGLTLAASLEAFWTRGGFISEGVSWFEALLPHRAEAPPSVAAAALASAARLALDLGDVDKARPWAVEAEAISRTGGDRETLAWSLHCLGMVAAAEHDIGAARERLVESSSLFASIDRPAPAAGRLTYLAELELQGGDAGAARRAIEQARALYEQAGDGTGAAGCDHSFGDIALTSGDVEGALGYYRTALEQQIGAASDYDLAHTLAGIATCIAAEKPDEATAAWDAVRRFEEEAGRRLQRLTREIYAPKLDELSRHHSGGPILTLREAVDAVRSL